MGSDDENLLVIQEPTAAEYDVAFYQPWVSALYAPRAPIPPGGAETQIQMVARGLAERGKRVAVIADPVPGMPGRVDGVDIIPRPESPGTSPLSRLRRGRDLWRFLVGIRTKVLVKRVPGFDAALVALAAKRKGCRFVYSSSSVAEFDWTRFAPRRQVAMFELGVRLADRVVVQSDEQRELCLQRFGRTPVVVRSIAEPVGPSDRPGEFFLWVGRLLPNKRPHAFVELARALPRARFVMVAVLSSDHDPALHDAVVRADRELDNFRLMPSMARNELLRVIESAVAVVNTSRLEGMSNVLLEGWGRGIPALVLSCDPDGIVQRERLGEFAAGSEARLAELAGGMWEKRDDRTRFADRCVDYVAREHSFDAAIARWAEVLER
jgi:glycosyltransferase involved in cell wall biosynthesis